MKIRKPIKFLIKFYKGEKNLNPNEEKIIKKLKN